MSFRPGQEVLFPVAEEGDETAKGTIRLVSGSTVTIAPAAGQRQFDGVPTVVRMDQEGTLVVPPAKKA